MSEPAAETIIEKPEAPAPAAEPAQETDWKAEARKWETRAKENSKAAQTLAEIEEANKTAEQKLLDRANTAEQALAKKELESERHLVALEKGLTASQAKRLVGSTRDEFLADADQLLADLGDKAGAPAIPKADPSQGPSNESAQPSAGQMFADHIKSQLGQ